MRIFQEEAIRGGEVGRVSSYTEGVSENEQGYTYRRTNRSRPD